MQPIADGLTHLLFLPGALLALLAGTLAGITVGLMPGVSSRSGLLIAIPFVLWLDPLVAGVFLIALHAASQISGTVPAVLFGAPTSASEAATAIDGYPLALRGEGARVIGTIISASAVGGVAGAAVLLLLAPVAARVILAIGSPEIAALAAAGILAIASVSSNGLAAGIALGAAGILASTVGLQSTTGVARFTFGHLDLLDGFGAPALIAGVMAIPELLRLESPRHGLKIIAGYRQVLSGTLEPFRHAGLTLRSSIIGLLVGITPGIGSSVAAWLSYGQAAKSAHSAIPFGKGAIQGVIAPEAASGAKEGGAFVPTLLLGVPGSSSMAIILGAFAVIGIRVGPSMLQQQPSLPATVAFTIAAADVLALLMCLALAPQIVRLASLPRRIVVVFSLVAALLAAFYTSPYAVTALETLAFAAIGVGLARGGLSRPSFLIGFIIGPVFESALLRSSQIFGWSALLRPGVLAIAVVLLIAITYLRYGRRGQAPASTRDGPGRTARLPLLLLALVFAAAIVGVKDDGALARLLPTVAATIGLLSAGYAAWQSSRAPGGPTDGRYRLDLRLAAMAGTGLLLAAFVGPLALALPLLALFLPALDKWRRRRQSIGPGH